MIIGENSIRGKRCQNLPRKNSISAVTGFLLLSSPADGTRTLKTLKRPRCRPRAGERAAATRDLIGAPRHVEAGKPLIKIPHGQSCI
jgi:hypothetical protein